MSSDEAAVPPGSAPPMRASDADRDAVVERLRTALAEGRLDAAEHADRLDAVFAARTTAELVPITHDLPATGAAAPSSVGRAVAVPAGASYTVEAPERGAAPKMYAGVFGAANRTGRWRVRPLNSLLALFGGVNLDMSEAVFEGREITVRAFALFGGIEVVVPDGVEVVDSGVGVFGGFSAESAATLDPGAPRVVVQGLAVFGGVNATYATKKRQQG